MASKSTPRSTRSDTPEHVSVSVRKIDNGWIESRSHNRGGEYKSIETYHASKPSLDVAPKSAAKPAPKEPVKVSGSMKPVAKAGTTKGKK